MRRRIVHFALVAALLAACVQPNPTPPTVPPPAVEPSALVVPTIPSSPAPSPSGQPVSLPTLPSPTAALPTPPPAPPVDPAIAPVSRTHPTAAARAAFDACGVYQRGLDSVARAGRVPKALELPSYTLLSSKAPELTLYADEPAWVVEFRGEFVDLMAGQTWIDETCVVIRGRPGFYATGPVRDLATGRLMGGYATPSSDYRWSLPGLAP